jgi:hypothetical protein
MRSKVNRLEELFIRLVGKSNVGPGSARVEQDS